jgi:hypothetical protein
MRRALFASVLALLIGACGSTGGGSAPIGGGTATDAPKASPTPMNSAGPSGDPYVDGY